MKDPLGNITKICYNTFNAPESVTDANGIVTKYAYNDAGLVTRMERLDGSETLTSLSVAYDAAGRLVREGNKRYTYGYLDKVMSVTDGDTKRTFTYRAGLAKWQTADPMCYPDGWNQLAYCGNGVTGSVDLWGCLTILCVSGGRHVHFVGDIGVYKTSSGTNEGGVFDVHVQGISGVGGDITITLTLSIYMDECLRENAEFMIGEQSEYAPHEGVHDNSMGRNCVYEAIKVG